MYIYKWFSMSILESVTSHWSDTIRGLCCIIIHRVLILSICISFHACIQQRIECLIGGKGREYVKWINIQRAPNLYVLLFISLIISNRGWSDDIDNIFHISMLIVREWAVVRYRCCCIYSWVSTKSLDNPEQNISPINCYKYVDKSVPTAQGWIVPGVKSHPIIHYITM